VSVRAIAQKMAEHMEARCPASRGLDIARARPRRVCALAQPKRGSLAGGTTITIEGNDLMVNKNKGSSFLWTKA